jgi:outer membrane lipoprotein LolB
MPAFVVRLCLLLATILVAACAHKTGFTGVSNAKIEIKSGVFPTFWSGRIGLQIQSDPPQAFFAGFELKGQANSGELTLISPLGSILGIMRWTPNEAVLEQGSVTRRFASADELLTQITGAAVPLSALFDWLAGIDTPTPGWVADLSKQPDGRISARKTDPAPAADLRIVLNP